MRVLVGSNTADGILAYDWNPATGELAPAGVAAKLDRVDWLTYSEDRKFLFAASEVDNFNGKPTGGVVSFSVANGELTQLSRRTRPAWAPATSLWTTPEGCWSRPTTTAAARRAFW